MKANLSVIEYNKNLPMGAYHDDPIAFYTYEKFFNDFLLVANKPQDWLEGTDYAGNVHSLNIADKLNRQQKVLHSKKFKELIKDMPKRKFVTYSPLDPPYVVNPLTYLMNSPTISHAYENKRYFREEFSDLIRMPEYIISNFNELDKAASYKDIKNTFDGENFVLQDEESHGSRGTYIVRNYDEYVDAVACLKKYSIGRSIVVSKFIKGQVCSIQVCVSKYGIFSAGIQKQLIGSKYLCNPDINDAASWCGGELGGDIPDIALHQAQETATIIGSELASHGYKGIFGVDIIITPTKEVFAIEINARHTGYSHIISDMQLREGKIPFMLLHALELGNIPYEVSDLDALPSGATYKNPISYLVVSNSSTEEEILNKDIKNGVYEYKKGELRFIKSGYSIEDIKDDGSTLLIHSNWQKGDAIAPGRRILKITKFGKSLSRDDLNPKSQAVVKAVKEYFGI